MAKKKKAEPLKLPPPPANLAAPLQRPGMIQPPAPLPREVLEQEKAQKVIEGVQASLNALYASLDPKTKEFLKWLDALSALDRMNFLALLKLPKARELFQKALIKSYREWGLYALDLVSKT